MLSRLKEKMNILISKELELEETREWIKQEVKKIKRYELDLGKDPLSKSELNMPGIDNPLQLQLDSLDNELGRIKSEQNEVEYEINKIKKEIEIMDLENHQNTIASSLILTKSNPHYDAEHITCNVSNKKTTSSFMVERAQKYENDASQESLIPHNQEYEDKPYHDSKIEAINKSEFCTTKMDHTQDDISMIHSKSYVQPTVLSVKFGNGKVVEYVPKNQTDEVSMTSSFANKALLEDTDALDSTYGLRENAHSSKSRRLRNPNMRCGGNGCNIF